MLFTIVLLMYHSDASSIQRPPRQQLTLKRKNTLCSSQFASIYQVTMLLLCNIITPSVASVLRFTEWISHDEACIEWCVQLVYKWCAANTARFAAVYHCILLCFTCCYCCCYCFCSLTMLQCQIGTVTLSRGGSVCYTD
jgi:hypothetical protein